MTQPGPPPTPDANCQTCSGAGAEPAQVPYGGSEFYQKRYDDFKRRHPGMTPPSYYLGYGKKYADRFIEKTYATLSPAGQAWLMRARRNLQEAMEKARAKDPAAFDKLEQNDAAFKQFAYDTHPKAYLDAGLKTLPVTDLVKIGMTPDFADLFSKDGLNQVVDVAKTARPIDVWNVGTATVEDAASAVSSAASRAWTSVVDWWNK